MRSADLQPDQTRHRRRRAATAAALTLVLAVAAGCSGSSLDDSPAAAGGPITIGLILPKTLPYVSLGNDMRDGWNLYLKSHGDKLGGHAITVVEADEGKDETDARNAMRKLLDSDKAMVLTGTVSAVPTQVIAPEVTKRRMPFVGMGGRPSTITDISHVWHVSWLSRETGAAIAPYLARHAGGPVYAIGPDYQGGKDQMGGFTDAFRKAGGVLANAEGNNPIGTDAYAKTPYNKTKDFKPFLNKVRGSGAKAVYCFYAGGEAVQFVKDYRDAGLSDIPLYGAGFLTEGVTLTTLGAKAAGIYTVLNYAPTVQGLANDEFVADFQAKYQRAPTLYNVTGFDAAQVLDQAIAAAGPNPTGETINTAISKVGQVNSPRGLWRFNANHEPDDQFFLRHVELDGDRVLANVVTTTLNPTS